MTDPQGTPFLIDLMALCDRHKVEISGLFAVLPYGPADSAPYVDDLSGVGPDWCTRYGARGTYLTPKEK